jgi:hypothetical protein
MGFFDDSAGIPGISWDGIAKGTKITGVVVPNDDGKAYTETQQTHIDTGAGLTYNDGSPRMQAILILHTELRKWEHVTDKFLEKVAEDPEMEDNGDRKLYVRGASLTKEFKRALKAAGLKDVAPGLTVTVTFVGKKPIPDSQFKSNVFAVEVQPPTPESMAKVSARAAAQDSGGSLGEGSDAGDDEPPF